MLRRHKLGIGGAYDLYRSPNQSAQASLLNLALFPPSRVKPLRRALSMKPSKVSVNPMMFGQPIFVRMRCCSQIRIWMPFDLRLRQSFGHSILLGYTSARTQQALSMKAILFAFGALYPAYCLHTDELGAFIISTVPTEDPLR
jgi:hypothetical protein